MEEKCGQSKKPVPEEQFVSEPAISDDEQFISSLCNIYSISLNPEIKRIRRDIEKCFSVSKYANKDIQRNILKSLILKIIHEETLDNKDKEILYLKYINKKFLRPKEEIYFKDCLIDFVYSSYEFDKKAFENSIKYIDKISNVLYKEEKGTK